MRIQHNIMAMNAYRNFGNNTSALSKNLEKLSSGYKINRAGDDAAGLAISEKMRAQITGLKAAQKNVKDGISLVKTAEGAMQEIHDMLNRMDYLATQSANGTYDNEVDRANLQKEVESLKSEIDRISKSANFNGQKLLDGSLDQPKVEITTTIGGATIGEVPATANESVFGDIGAGTATTQTIKVSYIDASGSEKTVEVEYTGETNDTKNAENVKKALAENSELSSLFDVSLTGKALTFKSKQTGEGSAKVLSMSGFGGAPTAPATQKAGENAKVEFNLNTLAAGTNVLTAGGEITINGTKYALVADEKAAAALDKGVVGVLVGTNDGNTVANLNKALESKGIKAEFGTAGKLLFSATKNGSAMKLQIGDTSADYEQLDVTIGNMDSASLGIGDLNIGTPEGAHAAIDKIKAAINTVSSTRGDLGAIQNRLEHTQNNLSVMKENIQDAESTIRDTDVAEEMMAYTKNNILIQSAQAMLAQANQVPQGVLQLMQ